MRRPTYLAALCLCASLARPSLAHPPSRAEAAAALRKAAGFFYEHCSKHGGYVWRYSRDLKLSEGEAETGESVIWVQPPGTPAVGMAFLEAFDVTGDALYLKAAQDAADALVHGQMRTGGWFYSVEFDPEKRAQYGYRANPAKRRRQLQKTTLDDNTTQAATRFLVRIDKRLAFENKRIHDAAAFALEALLRAQHPNGGWYQNWDRYPEPPSEDDYPVLKASYPDAWSRRWLNDWTGRYFLNDNVARDMVETMLEAWATYGESRYLDSAQKAGDFLLLAQMPDPQPAWAQQYDVAMHPVWDRKFEPPAVSGLESQGVMETLMLLYRKTGHARYLEPIPQALEYLRGSQLPDGRLARFYELRSNRPLYFKVTDGRYDLTYSDDDLPTHYGFKVESRLDGIEAEYDRLRAQGPSDPPSGATRKELTERVRSIIAQMDARGAWVDQRSMRGFRKASPEGVIQSQTFIDNIAVLCRFLAASE